MKTKFLYSSALILVVSLFLSCSNFLQGSELKQQIDDAINLANSDYFNVEFALSDPDAGQITPAGIAKLRKGEIFDITISLNSTYSLTELEIYEKNNNALTYNPNALKFLKETSTSSYGIESKTYTFQVASNKSELLILAKTYSQSDTTPPLILNNDTFDLSITSSNPYFSSGGGVTDLGITLYAYEKETNINPECTLIIKDFQQNRVFIEDKNYTLDCKYIGSNIYQLYCYLDEEMFSSIPENAEFYIELGIKDTSPICDYSNQTSFITIWNKWENNPFTVKSETNNSYAFLFSIDLNNNAQFDESIITSSELEEMNLYNNLFALSINNIDPTYLDITNNSIPNPPIDYVFPPLEIGTEKFYWSYTQDINQIENLNLLEKTVQPKEMDDIFSIEPIELSITPNDIYKDTYIVIQSDMYINRAYKNTLVLPACPKFLFAEHNEEKVSITIGNYSDTDESKNRKYYVYAKTKDQEDFTCYEFKTSTIELTNIEDEVYFQTIEIVNTDEYVNYYLCSPLTPAIDVKEKTPDSEIVCFEESSDVAVKCLGDNKMGYHTVTVSVDSATYNQFDSVIAYFNGTASEELTLSENNTISFDVPSTVFYASNGIEVIKKVTIDGDDIELTNEEFTNRCDFTFSLIGIKNNAQYPASFTIPKSNTSVNDNIPPVIPTEYEIDGKYQTLTLTKYVYDYGFGFINANTAKNNKEYYVKVNITSKLSNYSTTLGFYNKNADLIRIPIYFLQNGTYDITITLPSYKASATISDFVIDKYQRSKPNRSTSDGVYYTTSHYASGKPAEKYTFEYYTNETGWVTLVENSNDWTRKKGSEFTTSYMKLPDTMENGIMRSFINKNNSYSIPSYYFYNPSYETNLIDFNCLGNSILIYTDKPFFAHIIVSNIDNNTNPSQWEAQCAIPVKENNPIPGAPALDYNTEINPVYENADHTQTPYRYYIPWDKLKYPVAGEPTYAALLIYLPNDECKTIQLDLQNKKIIPLE